MAKNSFNYLERGYSSFEVYLLDKNVPFKERLREAVNSVDLESEQHETAMRGIMRFSERTAEAWLETFVDAPSLEQRALDAFKKGSENDSGKSN